MENKTAIQIAIKQIDADIEAYRTIQGDSEDITTKVMNLSLRQSLESFRKVLLALLPTEQSYKKHEALSLACWVDENNWFKPLGYNFWIQRGIENPEKNAKTDSELWEIYSQQKGK